MTIPSVSFTATPSTLIESERTLLTYNFIVDGDIPSEGLVVTVNSDTPGYLQQFSAGESQFDANTGPSFAIEGSNVTVVGGEVGEVSNDLSSFEFTITQANASLSFPIFNDIISEENQSINFSLGTGAGYVVAPNANQSTVTLQDGPNGRIDGGGPVVSISSEPARLVESDSTELTITFNVDGTIPTGGLPIFLDSGVPGIAAEFGVSRPRVDTDGDGVPDRRRVEGVELTGVADPFSLQPNETASGFFLTITEPVATFSVNVFNDGLREGIETVAFSVIDGEAYEVNPDASTISTVIADATTVTGNDIFVGDSFSGGSGSDIFVFGNGDGTNNILDFQVGVDVIGLV